MPLQNRVTPEKKIVRESWRGVFMGNRGGRIHDPETKTLLKRKWASRRWIICVTEFKQRQRKLMGNSYTELFFLDEISALAAGHRPCFECRRKDAKAFASAWITAYGKPVGSLADAMDELLHQERTRENKPLAASEIKHLPDGSMIKVYDSYFAIKGTQFLKWSGLGYHCDKLPSGEVFLLTPRSTVAVLNDGYKPHWHRSAT